MNLSLRETPKLMGTFPVTVRLLVTDDDLTVDVPDNATGKWLLDEVCKSQNVYKEKEYFGLRCLDKNINSPPCKRWLELTRTVYSQLKANKIVSFRLKHYPSNPLHDLQLPATKYMLYHQLRRDLVSGRLIAPVEVLYQLAAYVVQEQLGDHSVLASHPLPATKATYMSDLQVLHNQKQKTEEHIIELHKSLERKLPTEAADALIVGAFALDTYAVDPVKVKAAQHPKRRCHLGVTPQGIKEFLNNELHCVHTWRTIDRMSCSGKEFNVTIILSEPSHKKKKMTFEYKCESSGVAAALWAWAVDSKIFYSAEKVDRNKKMKSNKSLFWRSHTFTFAGRTRRELLNQSGLANTLPLNGFEDESLSLNSSAVAFGGSMRNLNHVSGHSEASGVKLRKALPNFARANGLSKTGSNSFLSSSSRPASTYTMPGASGRSGYSTLPRSFGASQLRSHASSGNFHAQTLDFNASDDQQTTSDGTGAAAEAPHADQSVPHWQMAELFAQSSRRKFAPETEMRQRQLLSVQHDPAPLEQACPSPVDAIEEAHREPIAEATHELPFDSSIEVDLEMMEDKAAGDFVDAYSTEAAVEAMQSAVQEGDAWAAEEKDSKKGNKKGWLGWLFGKRERELMEPVDSSTPQKDQRNGVAGRAGSNGRVPTRGRKEEAEQDDGPVPAWKIGLFSSSVFLGLTVVGVALLLEADLYSPTLSAIRGHPWMLDFESRCYRPLRSAISSLARRS